MIEKKKLAHIIEEISNASIENFGQAAALINAFGNQKEALISQINFSPLNKQLNNWQSGDLIKTSNLASALDPEAVKILLPFSEAKFLALSHQIKGDSIRAFTSIVSKLPAAEQLSVINKISWLELLDKSPRNHFAHINNIARIAQFYLQSESCILDEEMKRPLLEYLKLNHEDIKIMIKKTLCKNYSAFYNSMLILAGINQNETANILDESINGFCNRFEVFPQISTYVSRLFYLFYTINPDIAYKIILHKTVNQAFKDFFRSERIHENPEGTKVLIKAVRNSNKKLWQEEFIKDEKIIINLSSYDLPALYNEQDKDRKQMKTLGLDYFKIDAGDKIESNI